MNVVVGFDNYFAKGVFTDTSKNIPLYDFVKMKEFCRKKGIPLAKMTDDERKKFELKNDVR